MGLKSAELPCDWWPDVSGALLDLAESGDDGTVRQVAALVTDSQRPGVLEMNEEGVAGRVFRWVATFDEQRARRLFDYERLIPLLAAVDVPDAADDELVMTLRAAALAARQLDRRSAEAISAE